MDALVGGLEEIKDLEKPCPLVYSSHMCQLVELLKIKASFTNPLFLT